METLEDATEISTVAIETAIGERCQALVALHWLADCSFKKL